VFEVFGQLLQAIVRQIYELQAEALTQGWGQHTELVGVGAEEAKERAAAHSFWKTGQLVVGNVQSLQHYRATQLHETGIAWSGRLTGQTGQTGWHVLQLVGISLQDLQLVLIRQRHTHQNCGNCHVILSPSQISLLGYASNGFETFSTSLFQSSRKKSFDLAKNPKYFSKNLQ
jgi:hypothetical protein